MSNYVLVPNGGYRCKLCGKIVKELGWFGHNRYHRRRANKSQTKLIPG